MKAPCGGDAFKPALDNLRKPMAEGEHWPDLCKMCSKNSDQFPNGKCDPHLLERK